VEDNGIGMSKDIQERVFDPFFTTKSPEKGTGLGLAIVGTILHEHNATIELQSEFKKGTTFTIIFPTASERNN
jgi:signal transduction histidine kinase